MIIKENKNFIFDRPEQVNWKYPIKIILARLLDPLYRLFMDIGGRKATYDKKYKVSICAIFRNEASYLKEWLEFHKIVGVEHFYLYNNFSEDNYREILRSYIECGEVTLIEWPYPQGQMPAYRDCIERYSQETQWIGFIDIDEYVVPIKMDTIYDFLRKFSKRSAVAIYWRFFGTSGFMERDTTGLVTEDFTVSWPKYTNIGKCFYNTSYTFAGNSDKNCALHHLCYGALGNIVLPPVNIFDHVILYGRHRVAEDFPIQINHYYTKSWKEYQLKKQKPDVYFVDNSHTDKSFFYQEMKCTNVDYSAYKFLIKLKAAMRKP